MDLSEKSNCTFCHFKSQAVETLDTTEITLLEKNCAESVFKKNAIIFQQGSLTSHIAYIRSGLVKIHKRGPSRDQILKIVKPLRFIGIPTILNGRRYQYSATALVPTNLCFIDTDIFKNLILQNGSFGNEIINELCQDELRFFDHAINRLQKQIHGRVAEALLYLSTEIFANNSFLMPLSGKDLGDFVHASRETITRTLSRFKKEGLIDKQGRQITILDYKTLLHISRTG
ncbi:MAG: Crp/Fnr family transcriptional regulator [Bacteroidales bacterium]|jgi:CRP/FNR family transcriptional regulator|nr:Crp/Fnr family transcriptional regulator [Bacteroidales bacterium]MCK9448715.1 Crp/Fnr family transcriptional regulator [Bacteroidales bacterium]MDD3702077.1 Crp/Fnr family transcriptional regulator [Bacteroidales bacterium]MDY0369676.1 Crp/Fnr family transcriptional regulator [Bacteroidales bacterium]